MAADIVGGGAVAACHGGVLALSVGVGECHITHCQRISDRADFLAPIKIFKNLLTANEKADIIFEKTKQNVCPFSPQDTVPKG